MNTQAVVGDNLKFLDVATGFPGGLHDSRVLRITALYDRAERGLVLNKPVRNILNTMIRPVIIGDSAYPAERWILKPYTRRRNLNASEKNFNRVLSQARVSVEKSFGILKTRWRCLLMANEHRIENVSKIIIACCVLHNICQERNDVLDLECNQFLENLLENEREEENENGIAFHICEEFEQQRNIITRYLE